MSHFFHYFGYDFRILNQFVMTINHLHTRFSDVDVTYSSFYWKVDLDLWSWSLISNFLRIAFFGADERNTLSTFFQSS